MPKEQRQKLREDFLKTFVQALIINSYDPEKARKAEEEMELKQIKEQLKQTKAMPLFTPPIKSESITPQNLPPQPAEIQPPTAVYPQQTVKPQPPPHHLIPLSKIPIHSPVPLPPPHFPKLKPGQKPESINLGKVASILVDPAVISVECPGPGKNLLVNRSGSIQTSQIVLTEDEINQIMQNISEKTRIPLIPGVFKAAFQDLIITAVISDFVGTRFMIQKRTPFQRY